MFFVLFLYLECCILFKKVKTRLFNRYLFSIFCVVAIAVILVTLLIFTIYANLQISSARTYSVHQLEQVCQMTDMLYSQMRSVNNQILQNSNTNRCLSSNTFNRLIEADAGIKLREIQTAQSYTRYVSLYNSASNRFVSSSTADFLTDDDIAYYYRRLPDNPGADTCLLRMIGANYATQQLKTRYVYSFVFRVQLRKGGSPDLIIVDVDEDYFNDSISNLRTSNGFQQVLLLNRYGEVFSTNIAEGDSETFTHAKPDNTIVSVEDFPELTDNSGSFSYTCADHTEALVTYAKASSSGFTIFNIVPYSNIYSGLPQLAIITLLAGILVLCVGMFISFRTSAKLSAPIEVLYNNYVKKPSNDHAGDELDQLSKAFSDMYMKPISWSKASSPPIPIPKSATFSDLCTASMDRFRITSKYTKATASTSPRRITPSSLSVQPPKSCASARMTQTISFTATLSKTSPPKFWGSSAVSYRTAIRTTFS